MLKWIVHTSACGLFVCMAERARDFFIIILNFVLGLRLSEAKKVFITIDMEGITGVVDWNHVGGDSGEYEHYRKLMVGDLNAAIDGALAAGAKEIVISDSHGRMRNLHPWEVNEAAYLIRGSPKPYGMMTGIDEEFDAALFVGYHAMRGTENAILCHTYTLGVMAAYVNGVRVGEFGLNAFLAGHYGVPAVFIAGDNAVTLEAKNLVPNIHTAVVKWGVGRYAAKCLPPDKSTALIKNKVTEALENTASIKPLKVEEPVEIKVELSTANGADIASFLPYIKRLDGRTVRAMFDDYPSALKGLLGAIFIASMAERR
jgi:D-amino peptidase